ncbi:ARM repeat-containing protein [Athelia psychrophila]|uniref:ARM repeat-containing protein n=1 Tax=Athelia psychrophila TaxID=1759441 RepID=A0A167T4Z0_9AGAM|nr:ARM repeat-containing protein [Fibularhizoctonia sp. CBS 109695]
MDCKVKGLLNKLTMEKFDSISDQIITWDNKSGTEKDSRTLIQVIGIVFEKATDEATWSEMYAAASNTKRQGLGLIKFIGELFKLQVLTERTMHECVKKLLGNVENPQEEEEESLGKLLSPVGALLDTPKARAHIFHVKGNAVAIERVILLLTLAPRMSLGFAVANRTLVVTAKSMDSEKLLALLALLALLST